MSMNARIEAIAYYLPTQIETNADIHQQHPDWSVDIIGRKTGIEQRHIAPKNEFSSDLAIQAVEQLIQESRLTLEKVDYLVVCTQTPDYAIPTTACIIQHRLGLSHHVGAFDIQLGCSGYIYGLSVVKGLIASKQAKNVILITADTYSKIIDPNDRSLRMIFGDGATATWISDQGVDTEIGEFAFGTDGSGFDKLWLPNSGMHTKSRDHQYLYMNGPDIFNFTLKRIPEIIRMYFEKNNICDSDIQHYFFHQANKHMLSHLRNKLQIEAERFYINLQDIGNTVSSSIPIALRMAKKQGILRKGHQLLLCGFGVGLSWGATTITWHHEENNEENRTNMAKSS